MDTCATMGEPSGCNSFASPDNESKVNAVFEKNLAFALNVTHSLPNLGASEELRQRPEPVPGQGDPGHPAQPLRCLLRRDAGRSRPRSARSSATPTSPSASSARTATITIPMTAAPAGERYNEVKGYYFERRQATFPASIGTRAVQAGDIVNVVVKAGGLQQEFRYRIAALPDVPAPASRPRSASWSSPPRTTRASRRTSTPGYDTAPRYLDAAQGRARGRRLRGRDVRHRRPAGQRRLAEPGPAPADQVPDQPRRAVALRRRQLLHRRRLHPAGGRRTPTRAASRRRRRRPARRRWRRGRTQLMLRAARVRQRSAASWSSTAATSTRRSPASGSSLSATGPVHVDAGQAVRLLLPAEQRGRRRPARHRLAALARRLQRHLAELPRRRRPPVRHRRRAVDHPELRQPGHRRLPVAPKAGGLFAGMAPFTIDAGLGRRAQPERRRLAEPAGPHPAAPAQLGPDQRAAARRARCRRTSPPR